MAYVLLRKRERLDATQEDEKSLYLLTSVVRVSFDELDNRAMPTIIIIGPVHNAQVATRQTHSPNSASSLKGLKNMMKLDDELNQLV